MKEVTVKIYTDTEKGKNLFVVLEDMAKTGNDIKLEEPGTELEEYKKMQNPTDVKTVIINDTTPRAKGMIFLLDEMKRPVAGKKTF